LSKRVKAGDLHLHYELSGDGTPLVLTHGLGADLHFWDETFDAFAQNHRALRWSIRGAGASDAPPGPYRLEDFSTDLLHLLDALGIGRVHLLGISMGGVIAQRFALDNPGRLLSLVLISTSSEVGPRAVTMRQRLADQVERRGFDDRNSDASRAFAPSFASQHPDIVRRMGEATRTCDPKAYAAAARAVADYRWTNDLALVTTPTLILQGLDDLLTPPGGSVKMSRALPHSRLLMLPNAGHYLPLEQPALFTSCVLAFTAGVDLGRDATSSTDS
jgi:pimeloyl-ACP methyl ester carboxylesterase